MFEPFRRGDLSRTNGGMGLVLSIARSCAQAHGGDVVLANRIGGGLRAGFFLPI